MSIKNTVHIVAIRSMPQKNKLAGSGFDVSDQLSQVIRLLVIVNNDFRGLRKIDSATVRFFAECSNKCP